MAKQRDKQKVNAVEQRRDKKKEAFIEVLPKKGYHVGKTCKEIGISRGTYYLWRESDEDFLDKVEEQFQYDVDDSEEKMRLLRQGLPKFDDNKKFIGWIEKPHFGALVKHLEAKARDRGYGRHLTIEGDISDPISKMTDEELYNQIQELNQHFGVEGNE